MSKHGKTDDLVNRQDSTGEKTAVIKSDAPAEKFQTEAKVAPVMSAADTKTSKESGLAISEDAVPAQVVHTKKVSELVRGKSGIGGVGDSTGAFGLRSGSYSGNVDNIGDMSATPVVGKADRSSTRLGKKLDSTLKHINYLYNEQVTVHYDESAPLAENKDAVQGYNGTYHNEHARTQKRSGFVPAELYYDRSVDEIHQDFIYPVMGQSINDPYSTRTLSSYNIEDGTTSSFDAARGNFIHTKLKFAVDSLGRVTTFAFDEIDVTPDEQSSDIANISAVNAIIDANTAEIDRQNMDSNAGNENLPNWNPIPRSISDPTATISLARDIEASCGAELFMAYKKTAAGFSYQLSKAAKDGQRVTEPIDEMLIGCMNDGYSDVTAVHSVANHEDVFDHDNYFVNGSASLIISLFDSEAKYSTKGDFLLQPRGFRMHLQTAANNMDVFHVPAKFVKAVNNNEVFSTIDKEYDAFLPVCVSDKASLAHPISFNKFIKDNKPIAFTYHYTNNSNNIYTVEMYHPLVKGLYDFISQYGAKLYKLTGGKVVNVPCMHSTTGFSLWSLLLLAASPFMVKSRITSFIDFIDYEQAFSYPFSQLISLKDASPMSAKNYTNSSYDEPLKVGIMSTATAFKWVLPETYWLHDENGSAPKVVMPWYHNQLQYQITSGTVELSSNPAVMSMPSIRSGSRLGFLDTIYGMDERDVRLCLDRQTILPAMDNISDLRAYKYGLTTDGQVEATYKSGTLTPLAIVRTPREMGWVIPAMNGLLTQLITSFSSSSTFETSRIKMDSDFDTYTPGNFRIRYWQVSDGADVSSILASNSVNIKRAASLKQAFKTIINQRLVDNYDAYVTNDFVCSLSTLFTLSDHATKVGYSLFKPFVTLDNATASSATTDNTVSLQKYFWTRTQRLPFAINPFDCSAPAKSAASNDGIACDPYDLMYIFGCAGFRGSDYNEDSYNREKNRLTLGMLFVEDPYFAESPAYRD